MASTTYSTSVLPILTSRTRYQGGQLHRLTITTRQRFTPYPPCQKVQTPSHSTPLMHYSSEPSSVEGDVQRTSHQALTISPKSPSLSSSPDKAVSRPVVENDGLIPKPQGESGRKVRGYNVEDELKWSSTDMSNLKV